MNKKLNLCLIALLLLLNPIRASAAFVLNGSQEDISINKGDIYLNLSVDGTNEALEEPTLIYTPENNSTPIYVHFKKESENVYKTDFSTLKKQNALSDIFVLSSYQIKVGNNTYNLTDINWSTLGLYECYLLDLSEEEKEESIYIEYVQQSQFIEDLDVSFEEKLSEIYPVNDNKDLKVAAFPALVLFNDKPIVRAINKSFSTSLDEEKFYVITLDISSLVKNEVPDSAGDTTVHEHNYEYISLFDGTHKRVCKECGLEEKEKCSIDYVTEENVKILDNGAITKKTEQVLKCQKCGYVSTNVTDEIEKKDNKTLLSESLIGTLIFALVAIAVILGIFIFLLKTGKIKRFKEDDDEESVSDKSFFKEVEKTGNEDEAYIAKKQDQEDKKIEFSGLIKTTNPKVEILGELPDKDFATVINDILDDDGEVSKIESVLISSGCKTLFPADTKITAEVVMDSKTKEYDIPNQAYFMNILRDYKGKNALIKLSIVIDNTLIDTIKIFT